MPQFNSAQYWENILNSHKAEKAHRALGWCGIRRKKQNKKARRKERRRVEVELRESRRKRPKYSEYINSKEWKRRRRNYFRKHRKQCEICESLVGIELHHRSYEHLGNEPDVDLQALCRGCHENTHEGKKGWIMDPITREYLDICRNF